ncbi:DDE-type integrase/transposase/recombinase [Vibrio sp. V25_P4S6T154]|nr:DDE-type integrase/transposase/recombinase [Vibrio sp. V25_P4S6T154]
MCTYAQYRARYGSVRIAEELNEAGYAFCVNYVAAMTNVADNLLRRDFESETPNQKWVTDITYIWVKSRWLFLATVMDLPSRRIVGWSLGITMTIELITNALKMTFKSRKPPKGVIIYSDRGVQYRAYKYQDFMRKHGGVPFNKVDCICCCAPRVAPQNPIARAVIDSCVLVDSRCYFTGVHLDSITRDWALVSLEIFLASVSYDGFD